MRKKTVRVNEDKSIYNLKTETYTNNSKKLTDTEKK